MPQQHYTVVQDHTSEYPEPLRLARGAPLTVGERYAGPQAWNDWLFCETPGQQGGWVPAQLIETAEDGTARAREDYSARELDVRVGESLVGDRVLNGWAWCRRPGEAQGGWVPLENLRPRRDAAVDLRVAEAGDVQAMFEVRTSVRENHLSHAELAALGITPQTLPQMLQGTGRGWVATEAGLLLAFAMADADEATVFALFVRPGHEGRGLGRRLMHAAEQWLRGRGCAEVWLLTDADRTVRANGFYRHLGWTDDGIQADGQVRFRKRLVDGAS